MFYNVPQPSVMKQKAFVYALIVCLIFSWVITWVNIYKTRNQGKQNDATIEYFKKEKASIIQAKKFNIDKLLKQNQLLESHISKSKQTIDSLNKVKQDVRIVYIEKINKIKNLNANQIVNYWTNELK